MKYLWNILLSVKEIFIVMFMQYIMLFICVFSMGIDKSILWGSIILVSFEIIYIVWKLFSIRRKGNTINFSIFKLNYFPYILIGIGVNILYNMVIFILGKEFDVTVNFPIIITIICSGIIGPIFEELLFKYDLIERLEIFNSNKFAILLLSSIIFGVIHINMVSIVYGFIVGVISSYFYLRDKDFAKPLIMHIAGNICAIFLTGYNFIILVLGTILTIIGFLIIKFNKYDI